MAEGFLRHFFGDRFKVESAGMSPTEVNRYAIKVMDEVRIDIAGHHSNSIDEFKGKEFDYVVTVCDSARETCPLYSEGVEYLHWSIDDPSQVEGSEEEILEVFRKTRDKIRELVEETFGKEE